MSLKVGDKVIIKPKEWFDQFGYRNDSILLKCCGKEAIITENTEYGYSLNIGPKDWYWMECCFESIGYGYINTCNSELKKSVIVNVPIDMEVSTHESNGRITINVQHKNNEVEDFGRVKNGETYWHITELGTAISGTEKYDPLDDILYKLKNYFKTEELAKKALPKYKEFFENLNIK